MKLSVHGPADQTTNFLRAWNNRRKDSRRFSKWRGESSKVRRCAEINRSSNELSEPERNKEGHVSVRRSNRPEDRILRESMFLFERGLSNVPEMDTNTQTSTAVSV